MNRPGLGPVTAAQTLVSHSHPGRVRNDAAFAALAGTAPIPASSGLKTRHRPNRGGDCAPNQAIHAIAVTRMRCDASTRDYVAKCTAEGKTTREIYKTLNPAPAASGTKRTTQGASCCTAQPFGPREPSAVEVNPAQVPRAAYVC